jgi:hypothetical protein
LSRLDIPFGRELFENGYDGAARDAEFGREAAGGRQPGTSLEAPIR